MQNMHTHTHNTNVNKTRASIDVKYQQISVSCRWTSIFLRNIVPLCGTVDVICIPNIYIYYYSCSFFDGMCAHNSIGQFCQCACFVSFSLALTVSALSIYVDRHIAVSLLNVTSTSEMRKTETTNNSKWSNPTITSLLQFLLAQNEIQMKYRATNNTHTQMLNMNYDCVRISFP